MTKKSKQKQISFILVAAISLVLFTSFNHASADSEGVTDMTLEQMRNHDLEKLVDEYMKERVGTVNGATGAAAIIVKDNEVLFKKGYGYADVDKQLIVDPDQTLFRIGSVTKTFTAGAVLQLVEQGQIELEADISNYLDDIKIENPFATPVTVHHLLTHTSGFAATVDSIPYEDLSVFVPLEDYIQLRQPIVIREPGTSFMYDNFAYNLLGYIVERVSGKSYEQYMKDHIFEPLKMNNTHTVMREAILQHFAANDDGLPPYSMEPSELPAGGMITTAEDMGKFLIAQLNGGQYGNGAIWSDATVSQMFSFQSSIHPAYPDASYGYENWLLSAEKNEQSIVAKGGDIPGYSSFIMLLPEHRVGVFIVFNKLLSAAVEGRQWNQHFMEHYFPAENVANVEPKVQSPQHELERLEGTYSDLRLFVIQTEVFASGNGELTITDSLGSRILKQIDHLLFVDDDNEQLAFKEEADGSILYMKYRNPVSYSKKYISSFSDIDADSEYLPHIQRMELMGIMKGRGNGRFHAKDTITRAEMSVLLGRILGIEAMPVHGASQFADTAGHWAEREVETLAALGVIQGDTQQYFNPNQKLTRQQAADMLMSAIIAFAPMILPADFAERMKLVELADGDAIENSNPVEAIEAVNSSSSIKALIAAGFIGQDVTIDQEQRYVFRPTASLTREEAALWINQFINVYVQVMSAG